MRVEISRKGYEGFTGQLGGVMFENGVSEDISKSEALRLGASIMVKDVETGHVVGPGQEILDRYSAPAPVVNSRKRQEEVENASKEPEPVRQKTVEAEQVKTEKQEDPQKSQRDVQVDSDLWTREKLEKLADERGIEGLREVASEYNVVGRKISQLIDDILNAQARLKT